MLGKPKLKKLKYYHTVLDHAETRYDNIEDTDDLNELKFNRDECTELMTELEKAVSETKREWKSAFATTLQYSISTFYVILKLSADRWQKKIESLEGRAPYLKADEELDINRINKQIENYANLENERDDIWNYIREKSGQDIGKLIKKSIK